MNEYNNIQSNPIQSNLSNTYKMAAPIAKSINNMPPEMISQIMHSLSP